MMHRTLGAGLFAIGLLLASTAISSAQSVLVRGNDTDPATLDHHKTSTISESRVLQRPLRRAGHPGRRRAT